MELAAGALPTLLPKLTELIAGEYNLRPSLAVHRNSICKVVF
jgi:hypothetical protein